MDQSAFCLKAIKEGVRLSGRSFSERRPVKIAFGAKHGQCSVTFGGNTTVFASVAASVVVPPADKPNEGILQIYVSQSQNASDEDSRQVTSHIAYLIERLIRGSRVVDPESLCILAGRRVWTLKVHVRVVVNAGNIIDACGVAALAALMHFRKQDVTVERGCEIIVHTEEERAMTPLPLLHHPVLVSFASHATDGVAILVDPDLQEEIALSNIITIGANPAGDVCLVNKSGGISLPLHLVNHVIEMAKQHARDLAEIVTEALNEDRIAKYKRPSQKFIALDAH